MIKYVIKKGQVYESSGSYCQDIDYATFYSNPPIKCRGEKILKVTFKVDKVEEYKCFVRCNYR